MKKRMEPWIPELLETIDGESELLTRYRDEEERIQGKLLKNIAVGGQDLSTVCLGQVRLENCSFLDCSFRKGEFKDLIFKGCNLSNCDFSDSYFERCLFVSSKGVGAKFCGSRMKRVQISDCNLNYSNFDSCGLEYIDIEDTELKSANLSQCLCRQVTWNRDQLTNASFFKTPLSGMDFTSSVIDGWVLSDSCSELKGAVVDLYQAAELSKRLGLVIK